MDAVDEFLLEEYKAAGQLTYHIDSLRNTLTGFFLTFAGVATAALTLLLKGEARETLPIQPHRVVGGLLFLITLVGFCVIAILARLRRSQLEHFRIINNIRTHFIGTDIGVWKVVQLSTRTLPSPSRRSGTYYWLVLILVVTATIFVGGLALSTAKPAAPAETTSKPAAETMVADTVADTVGISHAPTSRIEFTLVAVWAWVAFFSVIFAGDWLYFRLAQPPPIQVYATPPPL